MDNASSPSEIQASTPNIVGPDRDGYSTMNSTITPMENAAPTTYDKSSAFISSQLGSLDMESEDFSAKP
jgi:hypothetical protein